MPEFVNRWHQQAAESGLRVFPIRIAWDPVAGKWDKVPLAKDWVQRAQYLAVADPFDWRHANGYGIAMGGGYYALDVDDPGPDAPPARWIAERRLPPTREHATVSGGRHLIFALLGRQRDLRSRANIVPGLDARGAGGFIAFGEGYAVTRDVAPSILPPEVGEELGRQSASEGPLAGERGFVAAYHPPEPDGAAGCLQRALVTGPAVLRRRWQGDTTGLRDTSRSAMDHSVARLLGLCGLGEDVIVWALLERFAHGAAAGKGASHVAIRAAARSALKSVARKREDDRLVADFREPEVSDDEEAQLRRLLGL